MTKQIFKAWCKKRKIWISAEDFCIDCDGHIFEYDDLGMSHYSEDAVLVRAVGQEDKNGKMIFGRDIVDGVLYKDGTSHRGIIVYDYSGYRIVTKEISVPFDLAHLLTVIGNEFENPELLEAGE